LLRAVIQARMGSSRLPGKVLRALPGGRPVLEWVVRAAQAAACCDEIVVATTTDAADDAIEDWCGREDVPCVRGPVEDVLSRFVLVQTTRGVMDVIRLTADCPLHDPVVIRTAACALTASGVDYVTTDITTVPRGFDVEGVTASALARLDAEAVGYHRVHVLSAAAEVSSFRTLTLVYSPPAGDLRFTLDTPHDALLIDAVVRELGDRPPSLGDAVALLRSRPDLVAINASTRQKRIDEG